MGPAVGHFLRNAEATGLEFQPRTRFFCSTLKGSSLPADAWGCGELPGTGQWMWWVGGGAGVTTDKKNLKLDKSAGQP